VNGRLPGAVVDAPEVDGAVVSTVETGSEVDETSDDVGRTEVEGPDVVGSSDVVVVTSPDVVGPVVVVVMNSRGIATCVSWPLRPAQAAVAIGRTRAVPPRINSAAAANNDLRIIVLPRAPSPPGVDRRATLGGRARACEGEGRSVRVLRRLIHRLGGFADLKS
jgi:hypothetical protein